MLNYAVKAYNSTNKVMRSLCDARNPQYYFTLKIITRPDIGLALARNTPWPINSWKKLNRMVWNEHMIFFWNKNSPTDARWLFWIKTDLGARMKPQKWMTTLTVNNHRRRQVTGEAGKQRCRNRLRADGRRAGKHDMLRGGHGAYQVRHHRIPAAEISLVQRRRHHRLVCRWTTCTVWWRSLQHQDNILGIQVNICNWVAVLSEG